MCLVPRPPVEKINALHSTTFSIIQRKALKHLAFTCLRHWSLFSDSEKILADFLESLLV